MARGAGTCVRWPKAGCSKVTARRQNCQNCREARASKRTNCHPVSPRKEATAKGQARQGCAVKAKATGSSETFKPKRHSGKWEGNLAREKLSSYLISGMGRASQPMASHSLSGQFAVITVVIASMCEDPKYQLQNSQIDACQHQENVLM